MKQWSNNYFALKNGVKSVCDLYFYIYCFWITVVRILSVMVLQKNLNSEQMIIKCYKLSKHRTMNLFCLKTCLKLGVAHGLQGPFVHFCCLFSTSEKFWANTYETKKGNHSCFSTLFDLFKMPIVINNNNFGHWRKGVTMAIFSITVSQEWIFL